MLGMTLTQEALLSIPDSVLQNGFNTLIELKNFQRVFLLGRKMKMSRGDILP